MNSPHPDHPASGECSIILQMPATPANVSVSSALGKAERLARAPKNPEKVAATKAMSGVIETARRKPVTITQNGKPAAVMLSITRYREWLRFLNAVSAMSEEAEDEIWLAMAREAKKEGMASVEESEAFLRRLRKYGEG